MKPTPLLTFGSLFAGIGGFDLGFERAGMVCRWQVEIDSFCQRVLEKNWPDVKRWSDIRTLFTTTPERGRDWYVDVICGGFPCQDISNAGKGNGIDGKKSGLWKDYVRVIDVVRPRFVVVENVAALLVRGLDRVLGDLASLGYDAEWDCLRAEWFGLPHRRERVFVIAYRDGSRELQPKRSIGNKRRRFSHRSEAVKWVLSSGGVLRSNDGIPTGLDRIGPCGNAVVPHVAEWIGRRIVESVRCR